MNMDTAYHNAIAHLNQGVRIGNLILAYPSVEGAYKRGYANEVASFKAWMDENQISTPTPMTADRTLPKPKRVRKPRVPKGWTQVEA